MSQAKLIKPSKRFIRSLLEKFYIPLKRPDKIWVWLGRLNHNGYRAVEMFCEECDFRQVKNHDWFSPEMSMETELPPTLTLGSYIQKTKKKCVVFYIGQCEVCNTIYWGM